MTRLLTGVLALALLGVASSAGAEDDAYEPRGEPAPSFYAKAVDLTLVRPLGLVPIVVSGVGCAMGLPVAWFFQSPVDVDRICWRDPVEYTFTRPLGEF
jgi:hypothetical protein